MARFTLIFHRIPAGLVSAAEQLGIENGSPVDVSISAVVQTDSPIIFAALDRMFNANSRVEQDRELPGPLGEKGKAK